MGQEELARVRRGEPAPTAERAAVERSIAEGILRQWWNPWASLVLAAVQLWLLLTTDHPPLMRVLEVSVLLGLLGLAVYQELNRRGAARLLHANRRRWR